MWLGTTLAQTARRRQNSTLTKLTNSHLLEGDGLMAKHGLRAVTGRASWSEEEIEVLELQRELQRLAREYPRFRGPLNRLVVYARAQLRSEQAKRDQIVRSLKILLTEPFYRLRSARAEDNEDSELESERAKAA